MPGTETSVPTATYYSASFAALATPSGSDIDLVGLALNNTPSTQTGAHARRLRATTAGNVNVQFPNGSTRIIPFLAGESQDVQARKILNASTTATGIVAYY